MGRKLPILILLLWSPLALGSVILTLALLGIRLPPWTDISAVKGFMWSAAYGVGGVIGYSSGWLFVAKLSPQCNLDADEDYTSIAWGLSVGMLTCLVIFLQICLYIAHQHTSLDGILQLAVVTFVPVFSCWWALNKIAMARRESVPG
jgi:hypothetical protein